MSISSLLYCIVNTYHVTNRGNWVKFGTWEPSVLSSQLPINLSLFQNATFFKKLTVYYRALYNCKVALCISRQMTSKLVGLDASGMSGISAHPFPFLLLSGVQDLGL